ncbi:MAG: ABC transporter permease [Armatimonadetes bacterium]|nr:ABC transporter permease [Armatimonadota bacterium]
MMATLARAVVRGLFDNPVLLKELRIGMRERRIFIIQLLYLTLLSFAAISLLSGALSDASASELPEIGRSYYRFLFWIQLVMILMIAPSLTCGSVTGEKERQSLDMMMASRLTPAEIVLGKLGFAVAFMVLVLFSSLPLTAVVFFLGGVSPGELTRSYLELAVAVLLSAQLGLYFSTREARSSYATNQAYGAIFLCFFLFAGPYGAIHEGAFGAGAVDPWWLVWGNSAYLAVFLFLKALNYLQSKALYLNLMCGAFLPFYLGNLAAVIALASANADWSNDDGTLFWNMIVLAHLVLGGIFLNESGLATRLEREKFSRSLFARPYFWLLVLGGGLLVCGVTLAGVTQPDSMIASAGYGVLLLLSFSVIARSVHRLFGSKVRYAVVYFVLLFLACFLPVLGLLGNPDNPGVLSGVYLSPMLSVAYLWDPSQQQIAEMSVYAYLFLTVVLGILGRVRRRSA